MINVQIARQYLLRSLSLMVREHGHACVEMSGHKEEAREGTAFDRSLRPNPKLTPWL